MDRIYSAATYVSSARMILTQISESKLLTQYIPTSHSSKTAKSNLVAASIKTHTSNPACHISWLEQVALASIYQRQWFSRAWIVQEAILPSVLLMYTGPDALSWAHLGDVSAALRRNEAKLDTASFTAFVPEQDAAVPIVWNMAKVSKRRQTKCHANRKDMTNAHEIADLIYAPRDGVQLLDLCGLGPEGQDIRVLQSLEPVFRSQMASDYHFVAGDGVHACSEGDDSRARQPTDSVSMCTSVRQRGW